MRDRAPMGSAEHSFQAVARGVIEWRSAGRSRGRMPEALWQRVVALADEYGAYATARGVGVSYAGIRARMQRAKLGFVDVGAAAELANAAGGGSAGTVVELALRTGDRVTLRLAMGQPLESVTSRTPHCITATAAPNAVAATSAPSSPQSEFSSMALSP